MRQQLKLFITERNISIAHLHRTTGVHTTTIRKFLKTNNEVRPNVLKKIADTMRKIGFTSELDEAVKVLKRNGFAVGNDDKGNTVITHCKSENYAVINPLSVERIAFKPLFNHFVEVQIVCKNGALIVFGVDLFIVTLN